MKQILSASTIAGRLGCTPQAVGRIAKRYGIGQQLEDGRWVFVLADLSKIRAKLKPLGNPRFRDPIYQSELALRRRR